MLNSKSKIAVCSRSFSRHEKLRSELLQKFPNAKFNDDGLSLKGDKLVEYLADSEAAIIALEKIDHETLCRLPNLKLISKYGVGLDNIDINSLDEFKIKLAWTAGVNKRSVSELVFAHSLTLMRNTHLARKCIQENNWHQVKGYQLSDKKVGIIGFGNIGQDIAPLFKAFGCEVFVNDIIDYSELAEKMGVTSTDKDTILRECDLITIHTPFSSEMKNFFSKDTFQKMKKNSVLINTARGGIVNEEDALEALNSGHLGGLALDVFEHEPLSNNSPLISHPNCILSPHIGGSSYEAIYSMGQSAITGLYDKTKIIN